MDNLNYIMSMSVFGPSVVKPMTSEIAKSFTGLTFLDSLPRNIDRSSIFGITYMYDEVVVFDYDGKFVDINTLPKKLVKVVGGLRDDIVTIGFIRHGLFYAVDAYQREQMYGRQGSGWLSPTFGPAYFRWVLNVETLLRYAVFRDGIADMSMERLVKQYTGGTGNVLVRTSAKGLVEGDPRSIYNIDGMEKYE